MVPSEWEKRKVWTGYCELLLDSNAKPLPPKQSVKLECQICMVQHYKEFDLEVPRWLARKIIA